MKNFLKNNKNELIKISLLSLVAVLCMVAISYIVPTNVFCDLFTAADEIAKTTQEKIVGLATAICPLAIIVSLVLMFITQNDKKLATYRSIAITITVVYFLILLVNKGVVTDFIKDLVDNNT